MFTDGEINIIMKDLDKNEISDQKKYFDHSKVAGKKKKWINFH